MLSIVTKFHVMNAKNLFFVFCLALSLPAFAQNHLVESPDKIPAQIEAFQKDHKKEAVKTSKKESQLNRLLKVLPGKYSNQEQSEKQEMFFHVYGIVPIWEDRATDTHWFYENIATGFDPDQPFNQRIFSITENSDGVIERTTYTCELLKNHPLAHQDPQSLDYIQVEDLRSLGGCELEVKELEENHFMLRHSPRQCQTPSVDADYVIFEYHFFPEGVATLPLGFDKQDRLVWGEADTYYLFEREGEQARAEVTTGK